MNYELAKKLKDAGFPLKCEIYGTKDFVFGIVVDYAKELQSIMYPLLSELIDACGDGLWSLTKHRNIWQTNWINGLAGETAGKSPIEAVANLWLKLNEK